MTWFVHTASTFVKFLASGKILLHLDATLAVLCVMERVYSGTSDKGPSEIGTTSLQRTLVVAPC